MTSTKKPYQKIPIQDCGELLTPIPPEMFIFESPHPYQKLGAPYQLSPVSSPYYLRENVGDRLINAHQYLQAEYPHLRILVFDAYRPIEVQQFMVDYAFQQQLKATGLTLELLSEQQRQQLWEEVYKFWAIPSHDPATPPPHSTGAAVDVTLFDIVTVSAVNMGSDIDEISSRSQPDYFAESSEMTELEYHRNRQILKQVMTRAGFQQHLHEWWHFSYGDQMWAWLHNRQSNTAAIASYGLYS